MPALPARPIRRGEDHVGGVSWERHSPEWRRARNANREIGVPGVKPPRFVPGVACYLSGGLAGAIRNNLPCLIRSGSFSDSLARQKRRWRGINFLSLTGVLFPARSQESPPPIPALHET